MLFFQNFSTALEQLWTNKMRSMLTVLGIIIGVTSTMVVVSIVGGFSNYVNKFLEGLGTNAMAVFPRVIGDEMVQADIEDVQRSCPALSRVAPALETRVNVRYMNRHASSTMQGTTADFQQIRNFYVDVGRCFGPIDVENRRQVCVLGRDVLQSLEANESIVGDYVIINRKRFRVIGLLEKKGGIFGGSLDDRLQIPYTTCLEMYPDMRRYLAFWAQAESSEQVSEAKAQIINTLRRRHHLGRDQENNFGIITQDDMIRETNKITRGGTIVLTGIVAISLLVGGIGIMNVMLVSVTERTREIGLRKAMGARRRDILAQFLTEAVVLSLAGGIAGIGLGYAVTYLASLYPNMVDVSVPFWVVILGVGFSVVVGVLFGILPAVKAALLHPIDALRHE